MRSSVSYMLSHGSGEPTMSHPDYEQHAHHHASLLVLIRGIGNSKPRSLQRIFERIQNTNNIKITDSSGTNRNIWVRYVRDHPVENNEWGDFQTHRRLLGLITVGKFDSQTELNELCRVHESLKVKYTNTLYDSRCILFGSTNGKRQDDDDDDLNDNVTIRETLITGNEELDKIITKNSANSTELEIIQKQQSIETETQTLDSTFTTPTNFKSRAFFYPENDGCSSLESNIEEFMNALFWIIESKRLEKSRERIDKVALLLAPFEKKDMIGLDMDSRSNRKRCMGRITKHLGDLTLQSGLISESLALFHAANETLSAINDSLWIGAANEGLCAASSILLYPHIRTNNNTPINNLTNCTNTNDNNNNNHTNNCINTPTVDLRNGKIRIEKNTMVSIKEDTLKSSNKIENQNEHSHTNNTSPSSSTAPTSSSSSSSSSSSVSSILSNTSAASSSASTSTGSGSSSAISSTLTGGGGGTAEGVDTTLSIIPPNCLQPDDIATKYREAIIHYSKYRPGAGIIETEALLKAARICIEQNQKLNVAMFLQNILYINLNVSDFDRAQRFETLIKLYERIGYHRKAAFCYRLAAWRHIDQNNTNPDWSESYRLMLESFPGNKLTLNPIEVVRNNSGWPCLQIDLLQQLMVAAKRLGHSALATRHMTFLLQTMWKHLTPTEQREYALQLQSLSAQCEGAPVPLVLENGTIIPPSNLTDIPYCEWIQVKDLPSHLKPHKILIHKIDDGPFIFTPIHLSSSIDRRTNKKNESKIAFQWVQNDLCEVTVKLKNVLPFELKVSDIRLLTNGIVFESVPQTVVLPTGATNSTLVTLHGTPIECGLLEIEGYSTHALGIKSNCRLDNMSSMDDRRSFPKNYQIDVISALPKIKIETSLPQTATFSGLTMADSVITSASLTLFNGECFECTMTIINTSSIAIEFLECTLHSNLEEQLQNRIFSWVNSDIEKQLPIKSNTSIEIKIKIYGDADFFGSGGGGGGGGSGTQMTTAAVGQMAMSSSTISTHNFIAGGGGGGGGGSSEGPSSLSGTTGGILNTLSVLKHKSLPSRMNSPNSTPRRNDVLTSSFRSTRSGGQSSVTTLSLGAGNVPRQIEAQMRIRYSGGAGLKEGFCRQCAVSFCLELLPSAQIINWDILPAEMPSQFYLVLDVANLTAQDMSLKYTTNKTILIEAKETCRFPVPVERCPLEKLYDAMTNSNNENNDNPNSVYSIPLTEADLLERACSEHITNQVNLQWSLNGTETNGVASLKGLQLSSTMLGLITVAPLHWEITIDNTPILPQTEVKCCTGQMILFGVLIRNLSPTPLEQLTLTVQFYQDYQNGVHNYRLETRVTTSGPSQIAIDSLNHNDHIYHEFSVIFFAPGIYKTDLQCCSMAFNKSIGNPHGITSHLGSTTGTGGGGETQIWRYIPPIEITVNE